MRNLEGESDRGQGSSATAAMSLVAVPRSLFQKILGLIDDLRRSPVPALAEEIDGKVKSVGICPLALAASPAR